MNQRLLGIVTVVVLAVLVVAGIAYVKLRPSTQLQNASSAPGESTIEIGSRAPQFSIPTTQGAFDLNAATKPVFLEVFATWCPHCQRETKVINALYAAYGARVAFISIPGSTTGMDGTSPESPFDVLNFQIAFKVKYPIAVYDPNQTVAQMYLKGGYPTIAVIGKNKMISYLNSGEISQKELAAAINVVLKK
jgi:cytochrome c biogenesis protein CcmG, thiol:disulfide interchange protein DsbE